MTAATLDGATDEVLFSRYRDGDARAFDALVRRHSGGIYRFVFRVVGERAAAEDLSQEVFLRVLRSADGFDMRSRFTTWLYTIARNLCFDALRRKRVRGTSVSLDGDARGGAGGGSSAGDSGPQLGERVASDGPSPEEGAHDAGLRAQLVTAFEALPEEQREVFVMREWAGLPFEQIAEITGVPIGTVKSRMRYALLAMRKRLEEAGVTP